MKKVLVLGAAILVAVGISVPVIAAGIHPGNIQKEDAIPDTDIVLSQESAVALGQAANIAAELKTMAIEQAPKAEIEQVAEVQPEKQAVPEQATVVRTETTTTATNYTCSYWVDANGDGICDHCVGGSNYNACSYWVDANGDGICDHCVGGSNHNACSYWVDSNGDGICDHCVGGTYSGRSGGHHGGGHHGGRHH